MSTPGDDAAPGEAAREPEERPAPKPRYEERGELGRGGMGSVHRTYDSRLRREVARKVLHPERATPVARRRFLEEAQITGQLEHPNIVPIHDLVVGPGEAGLSFTMKLVGGSTLGRRILDLHASGFAETKLEEILRILLAVCDAVSFAHSRGVIHRDLKPANIMVGEYGQVYVMDWGIALVRGAERPPADGAAPDVSARVTTGSEPATNRLEKVGTPTCMAPEQVRGRIEEIDERTDVFGLGGILYEVLTGWPPFDSSTNQEVMLHAREAGPRPPQEARSDRRLPDGLCEIAMRALAFDPAARHPTVDDLRSEVAQFLRGGGWLATRRFRAGEVFVREGDRDDECYILVDGRCEVYLTRNGERVVVRQLGPGDVFGETAAFCATPRTASVVALDDVVVKVVTAETLERELRLHTWVGAFVRQLGRRFLEAEERLHPTGS